MWSCDTFQFHLLGVDKINVAGFTDEYSRYRMKSKISLYKNAASEVYARRDAPASEEFRVEFTSLTKNNSSVRFLKVNG